MTKRISTAQGVQFPTNPDDMRTYVGLVQWWTVLMYLSNMNPFQDRLNQQILLGSDLACVQVFDDF